MKKEIKKLWVNALKSGAYHQASYDLKVVKHGQAKFCCLGVLTQLYCNANDKKFDDVDDNGKTLPLEVRKWAGITSSDPCLRFTPEEKAMYLLPKTRVAASLANDEEVPFKLIAEAIDRSL